MPQRKGTQKESDRVRGMHPPEIAEGGHLRTQKNAQARKHAPFGDHRGGDESGHRWGENDQARLWGAEGRTCQHRKKMAKLQRGASGHQQK